jgi:hypothetical protein
VGCGHHGARGWQGRGVARDARFAERAKGCCASRPSRRSLTPPSSRGCAGDVSSRSGRCARRVGARGCARDAARARRDAPRVRVPRVDPAPGRRGRAEFGALGLASVASRARGASAGARRRRRRRRERRLRRGETTIQPRRPRRRTATSSSTATTPSRDS